MSEEIKAIVTDVLYQGRERALRDAAELLEVILCEGGDLPYAIRRLREWADDVKKQRDGAKA